MADQPTKSVKMVKSVKIYKESFQNNTQSNQIL